MAYRRYRKYAQSTTPFQAIQSRRSLTQEGKQRYGLSHQCTDTWNSGIGPDERQIFKNFFLSKDDQKKDDNGQRAIVEKKLSWALRYSKKTQNQGILRVIEEYAKEKGIPFDEQVKFQQYDLLEKPLVLQPTVLVTGDREWVDIFEKFKSENLKVDPNQNQSEFKKIINNNNLTTFQKIQIILKQRFTIHDASSFPNENPQIGNKDKDGNIIFMIDEQQIPHRVIFRNKEEYDIIDWFIQRTTKANLNVIKVEWSQYIRNVKKLRGDQIQEKRKIIKLKEHQQMQIEQLDQSQVEFIPKIQQEANNIQQIIQEQQNVQNMIEWKQKKPLQLKLKNRTELTEDPQLLKELELQNKIQRQQYIDQQMINDLQEVLSFDIDQGIGIQVNPIEKINNDDYIRILPQFPKEVAPQRLVKLSKKKNLQQELSKGFLYLNQEQITNLDSQISQYLRDIKYIDKQVQLQNNIYSITSPMYVVDFPHPRILTRQWCYFRELDHVRFYIIHSQILWYLYSQFQINTQQSQQFLSQVIARQTEEYLNRWTGLIIDDNQQYWYETTESDLIKAAEINMHQQNILKYGQCGIKLSLQNERRNVVFKFLSLLFIL